MTPPAQRLDRLARRLRRRDALALALAATAAALLLGVLPARLAGAGPLAAGLAALVAGAAAAGVVRWRRSPVTPADVAAHLDRTYPELEESAALLLHASGDLDLVARLQRARAAAAWASLPDPPLPRRGLPAAGTAFALPALAAAAVLLLPRPAEHAPPVLRASAAVDVAAPSPRIEDAEVRITPPAYTGRGPVVQDSLGVEALAESTVRWRVRLDRPADAALVFGGGDTLRLAPDAEGWHRAERIVRRSALYHLVVTAGGAAHRSPDARLVVDADRPPVLTVVQPEDRTVIPPGGPTRLAVEVRASDDVGLDAAHLVVTRAKGSGEAVTFREVTVPFARAERASPQAWTLHATLTLDTLGLEPGDGLYVHARARDRRRPVPGEGRSATFFVVLEDTTRSALALDAAFGVNPLPAYFRSQRQIIIDTERLIAERDGLPADSFRARAEALGVDQKILRLRYGQFLGEEFESGLTPPPDLPPGAADDHGDEEHAEEEHAGHDHEAAPGDDPGGASGGFGTGAEAMRAAYGHMHDSAEGATFYADDIEAALKAALAEMWEAELRLRTLRPEEALPYEYRALRMIKDLQQQARIYVQRVGFEPPPLRPAERRLTGELDDVTSGEVRRDVDRPPSAPALRAALPVLDALAAGTPPAEGAADALRDAGTAWAADALDGPGRDLSILGDLRALVDALDADAPSCRPCAERARAALWRALPPAERVPHADGGGRGDLARRYFDALR